MSGFSIDWLDLREPADRKARNRQQLEQVRQWLQTDLKRAEGICIVDLGAGTGSTLRSFYRGSTEDLQGVAWRLVDRDSGLLDEAQRRHGDSHEVETHTLDLTDISALPISGAQLVSASALFDLVSAEFVDRLAALLHDRGQQQAIGFYAALNYDGSTSWTPQHAYDDSVLEAFNRDQQRDKGFGPALGPAAVPYMAHAFKELGFQVFTADSPWELEGPDAQLIAALIDGIAAAITTDPLLDKDKLRDWVQFRKAHIETGTCRVGHTDLQALPKAI